MDMDSLYRGVAGGAGASCKTLTPARKSRICDRTAWKLLSVKSELSRPVTTPLNVAILAAGHGKRMHSALPKVLHPLAGRPLAAHVVDTVRTLSPRAIVVVVGNGAERVAEALAAPDVVFARQEPPLGTGDATPVALAAMPGDGVTLIGVADVPL